MRIDKMKILLIGPLPEPVNGVSYANAVFASAAQDGGLHIECINTSESRISSEQGRGFSLSKALSFVTKYRHVAKAACADVVYITPGQTFFGLLKYAPFIAVAKLSQVPYVVHIHGNHLGQHYRELTGIRRFLFRQCISHASAGIVLSESLRRNFDNLLPAHKVHVAENFAGDNLFADSTARKSNSKLRVLYLSNLMREKGILDLLDALSLLQQDGVDFEAVIAGGIEDGLDSEVYSRIARLPGGVKYVGRVAGQDKVDLLISSNVFVLPTYYEMEGQPIALLEGLASGNIILTTAHAGIPDVIGDANGYFIPRCNPQALAARLSAIGANLEGELAKFSQPNRLYAKMRFTERAFSSKIIEVLSSTMSSMRK